MSQESDEWASLLDRIAARTQSEADLATLRRALPVEDQGGVVQVGKYNIHIREGQDVHIGDTVYQGADAAVIRATILEVMAGHLTNRSSAAPFQAIDPPVFFIGREKEVAVLSEWLRFEHGSVIVIRGGVGGVGKTALAAHLARQLGGEFPDGVLWARLDTDDTLSILASFIVAFEGKFDVLSHLTTVDSRARYYRALVSQKRCLVVLDNADSAVQVAPLLPSGQAKVLITSRSALANAFDGARELHLGALSDDAALTLLLNLLEPTSVLEQPDDSAGLCRVLGNLPLAIRIAAGNMRELHWSLKQYLEHLQDSDPLDWLDDESASGGIRKSFTVSYANLSDDSIRRTFRVLGAIPQEHHPVPLLAYILGISESEAERRLLVLVRRGLVDTMVSAPGDFQVHPLMQYYAAELLRHAGEWQNVQVTAGNHYRARISRWDVGCGHFVFDKLATTEDLRVGLLAVTHYWNAGCYAEAQGVLSAVADQFTSQGNDSILLSWIERLSGTSVLVPWLQLYRASLIQEGRSDRDSKEAVRILECLVNHTDAKLASAALIRLAEAKLLADDYRSAEQLLNQSRTIKEAMEPPDQKGLALIQNELARIGLLHQVPPHAVLEMHQRALGIQERIGDVRGRSYTLRKIAALYLHNLGNLKQAEELLDRSEQLACASDDYTGLIQIWAEKAEILCRQQHYAEAVEILEKARQLAADNRNLFGEAYALKRLASVYETVELFGQAFACISKSQEIFGMVRPRHATELDRPYVRLAKKIEELREELQRTEALEAQAQINTERRMLRRRSKRLRQKLGLEPALIRLGATKDLKQNIDQ